MMYQARIYRLTCKCGCQKSYIGSTKDTLNNRWGNHKRMAKAHKNNTRKLFVHINEVGFEMFDVEEIDMFDCKDRKHQMEVEDMYIQKYNTINNGLNGLRAFVANDEKKQKRSDYDKHRQDILCECGRCVRNDWITRHKRSKQHQIWENIYDYIHS